MNSDFDACYRAVTSRDARFDGRFWTGVTSTRVYCRPSCPSRTPRPDRVRFYSHPAAAERAGFRACRRCRPQSAPDAPDWDVRADLVGRALRLIAEGVADAEGVTGLARRLAVGERHLHRQFTAALGAGPLAVARLRRVQLARQLLDETDLPVIRVAFAAGFSSLRQFNDSIQATYGRTPTELRARRAQPAGGGLLTLRLAVRQPLETTALLDFLAARAVPGVEEVRDGRYRRTVDLGDAGAVLELEPPAGGGAVVLRLAADDACAIAPLVARSRRLLDLDADPAAIAAVLCDDPLLAPLVARRPGLRLPGAYDGFETAVRTVLGQQVSVAAARTLAGRLVSALGQPLERPDGTLAARFPDAAAVAGADLTGIGIPASRAAALTGLARAVEAGTVVLDGSADPDAARAALLALPGIGPWTVEAIALRVLRDPDALPVGDLGLRHALARAGVADTPAAIHRRAERWRPWRGYALLHLWTDAADDRTEDRDAP